MGTSGQQDQDRRKVALVAGGSSSIGRAAAIEYAKLGYKVAITGPDGHELEQAHAELVAASPTSLASDFLALPAHWIDDAPAQTKVVQATVDGFGRLDVLVNSAHHPDAGPDICDDAFFDHFHNVFQAGLVVAIRLARRAAPHLVKTRGVIVNVSAPLDRAGDPPSIGHCVVRAGLSMLTKVMANALDGVGVRVVSVAPGPSSEEVANLIVFLTSDKASFIHGCTLDCGPVSRLDRIQAPTGYGKVAAGN